MTRSGARCTSSEDHQWMAGHKPLRIGKRLRAAIETVQRDVGVARKRGGVPHERALTRLSGPHEHRHGLGLQHRGKMALGVTAAIAGCRHRLVLGEHKSSGAELWRDKMSLTMGYYVPFNGTLIKSFNINSLYPPLSPSRRRASPPTAWTRRVFTTRADGPPRHASQDPCPGRSRTTPTRRRKTARSTASAIVGQRSPG